MDGEPGVQAWRSWCAWPRSVDDLDSQFFSLRGLTQPWRREQLAEDLPPPLRVVRRPALPLDVLATAQALDQILNVA
jgi:hypothetical protein